MSEADSTSPIVTAAAERVTTLLVVDDLEANRELIRQIFEPEYRVLDAADGATALRVATAERLDCIILDLAMPGLHGFEVLERLQRDLRTREVPVIIVTASGTPLDDMDRALRGGAVDYITKPISPRQVTIRVRGAIERYRLLREIQDLRANFTSMLVHDLRGPLTAIRGYLDLFEFGAPGSLVEKQQRYLHKMRVGCERMLGLIGEILDISKLEAGRLSLEPRAVDLAALVADVLDRLGPVARQKAIGLDARGAAGPVPLVADPGRLEQVLMNLVGNALKFTPDGGAVAVEIADLGGEVEVAVRDTGPGIAPEEMPLLFEPFVQTKVGRAAKGGTGIGLVVSRHLVEAHGGRIWAESEPGRGARFAFRLPRRLPPTGGMAE